MPFPPVGLVHHDHVLRAAAAPVGGGRGGGRRPHGKAKGPAARTARRRHRVAARCRVSGERRAAAARCHVLFVLQNGLHHRVVVAPTAWGGSSATRSSSRRWWWLRRGLYRAARRGAVARGGGGALGGRTSVTVRVHRTHRHDPLERLELGEGHRLAPLPRRGGRRGRAAVAVLRIHGRLGARGGLAAAALARAAPRGAPRALQLSAHPLQLRVESRDVLREALRLAVRGGGREEAAVCPVRRGGGGDRQRVQLGLQRRTGRRQRGENVLLRAVAQEGLALLRGASVDAAVDTCLLLQGAHRLRLTRGDLALTAAPRTRGVQRPLGLAYAALRLLPLALDGGEHLVERGRVLRRRGAGGAGGGGWHRVLAPSGLGFGEGGVDLGAGDVRVQRDGGKGLQLQVVHELDLLKERKNVDGETSRAASLH
ncbi:PE-PGRS family protein [Strigomonas culicis]|uniref:PE-PGRS family protein n=1 Tax=Strigomonas culicis TaxID=28005 RepID=S9UL98_9TRYP|nr:PE-PGRS family protein [Strigomonas culicis]|eukprot:EPY15471.1 PE-PGRS family protein [Strigomonas culicis]